MRVAIYARVSTDAQEARGTIGSQLTLLRERVAREGHELVAEYTDDGLSGARLDRPGLDALRDAAEAGQIEGVWCLSADRLARMYAYQVIVLDELSRHGVTVRFHDTPQIEDDPQARLLTQVQGVIAEYERAKIAERYRRGKLWRARAGEVIAWKVPYGYRRIPRVGERPAHLEVFEHEAAVVRRIFDDYVRKDISMRQIAKGLNRDGIRSPTGRAVWSVSTIGRILRNEAYIGRVYYNRTETVPQRRHAGKTRQVQRPRDQWIAIAVPAILDETLFEAAQRVSRDNSRWNPRRAEPGHWLLRGLVKCGHCGVGVSCHKMRGRNGTFHRYYYCHNHDPLKAGGEHLRCPERNIRADELDTFVFEQVRNTLLRPEVLLAGEHAVSARREPVADELLQAQLAKLQRKTADFEGGLISSDGGLVLLREAERRLGLAEALAGCIQDWRDPERVVHTLPAILRFRMFAIACGYEDADDCDALRGDPLFKLAVGRAPESGRDLCSQPTMSRLESAPSRVEVARMTAALVDVFCRSFPAPPAAITLDIDDTCDPVHGRQQLSLFNAHYDTRCFLPVHVYHVESGKPVAVLLRPGKTPSGAEIRTLLKHLVRRIRRHWPRTRLTFRGDSHYGRAEAMAWCEDNGVDYIFGLAGNSVLHGLAYEVADDLKVCRAEAGADRMRGFAAFPYAARSWSRKRRVVARLEATARGFDARYIVTSLGGEPRHLYEAVYCARGQAENLIKLHKGQLASDRTSCQSPLANQFRLVLHTAAYWLMLALRDAVPRRMPLAWAEFATLRARLLKIGARVVEKAARIRIHFASACPDAALFRLLAGRLAASGP